MRKSLLGTKLLDQKINHTCEADIAHLLKSLISTIVPAPVSDQRQLTLIFCSLPLFGRRNKGENKS
jgi:hypothetical protein